MMIDKRGWDITQKFYKKEVPVSDSFAHRGLLSFYGFVHFGLNRKEGVRPPKIGDRTPLFISHL